MTKTIADREAISLNPIEKALLWLSGSDAELIAKVCPRWEKVKYEAFGAAVLVPVTFGTIAAAYAVSTITDQLWIIIGFCLVWAFIILTIDRLLLATYRGFASKGKRVTQFILRVSIALLMGLTVSHPLTLLLFRDTIQTELDKQKQHEIAEVRDTLEQQKLAADSRIIAATDQLAAHQAKFQATLAGGFMNEESTVADPLLQPDPRPAFGDQFGKLDAQLTQLKEERDTVRSDLEAWQKIYDDEVRGVRSGSVGIGPNARAIQRDHIEWRLAEVERLSSEISAISQQRSEMSSMVMEKTLSAQAATEASRQALEQQKMELFAKNQDGLLEVVKGQIEASEQQIADLREEAAALGVVAQERIETIKEQPRNDLMSQSIALHDLFLKPGGEGLFCLTVYVILVGLFTAIDTLPLVTKFFSVAGPYDVFLHAKENGIYTAVGNAAMTKEAEAMGGVDLGDFFAFYRPGLDEPQTATELAPHEPVITRETMAAAVEDLSAPIAADPAVFQLNYDVPPRSEQVVATAVEQTLPEPQPVAEEPVTGAKEPMPVNRLKTQHSFRDLRAGDTANVQLSYNRAGQVAIG